MQELVLALISGILVGGTLSLVSLGMVVGYRATQTFNFAHGHFMLVAAFVLGKWYAEGRPFWLGVVVALAITGVVGGLFYRLVLDRTLGHDHFIGLIASLGLASVLEGVVARIFGASEYVLDPGFLPSGSVTILGVSLESRDVLVGALSIALAVILAFVFQRTQLGIRIQAAGQNAQLASQGGIDVSKYYFLSWVCAGALGGLAGVAFGLTNIVNLSVIELALLAFPVMILGGVDSIVGAIIASMLVGIFQGLIATYWSSEVTSAATYALVLIVLLVRPQGLFGTQKVVRV